MSLATTSAFRFSGIGTSWQVDTPDPLSDRVRTRIVDRVEEFDRVWSRFRPDSVVSCLRRPPHSVELPAEADALLGLYRTLADLTDGAMNPLAGASLEAMGYGPGYHLTDAGDFEPAPGLDALRWQAPTLRSDRPVVLDVGAAGKGLLVDLVADEVAPHSRDGFTVDASGDLVRRGPAIRVALEHPADMTRAVGVAELSDAALCASATNRRAWGPDRHHVVDARTGRPVNDVVATWVVAPTAMVADAVATALFFVAPNRLSGLDFEYVRFTRHGLEASDAWPGEVFA